MVANDNVVITVKWIDGSLATLLYTALGHGDLPKERIEMYASGSSMVIDDFIFRSRRIERIRSSE